MYGKIILYILKSCTNDLLNQSIIFVFMGKEQ